jgi:hypothetical protein
MYNPPSPYIEEVNRMWHQTQVHIHSVLLFPIAVVSKNLIGASPIDIEEHRN